MLNVKFKDWACELHFAEYPNGRTALVLNDVEDGSPVATCTINLPDVPLKDGDVIIKDYSENEGMLEALVDAGIVHDTGIRMQVGYALCPLCKLKVRPEEE